MKIFAKKVIAGILGWQVRRLRRKNNFKLIGVSGSIGKTSTKFAIAAVLGQTMKVRFQTGNYNDIVSVPLVFFGREMPGLLNPFAWAWLLIKNELMLRKKYPFDVVVVELGTDGPGQIKEFGAYLNLDIAAVTAITPEHMEFFETIDQVANEEFALAKFSSKVIANADLCGGYIAAGESTPTITYGIDNVADYSISASNDAGGSVHFSVFKGSTVIVTGTSPLDGKAGLYTVCAAAAVASELGMAGQEIAAGIKNIQPVNGRLRRLRGINQSVIIDDTYNSSPAAATAALDLLYAADAPQRIALLGNMNELGHFSESAHRYVGQYCRPDKLDLVVTIGPAANEFLAAAAEKQRCKVARFFNPISAGEYIKALVKPGAVILAKGSQNGVFAEEAVKLLLADPSDQQYLVRQSRDWLAKKARFIKGSKHENPGS